jgi:hypothetical protein
MEVEGRTVRPGRAGLSMEMRNGHRESQVIVHIIQPTWRGTNGVECSCLKVLPVHPLRFGAELTSERTVGC